MRAHRIRLQLISAHCLFRRSASGALLLLLILAPPTGRAQAWLPTAGQLDVGLSYTNVLNQLHYLPDGGTVDVGSTRTETWAIKALWGVTDRLAISAGLPYVVSWFMGEVPHGGHVDDGHRNRDFADWRLGLHYQLTEGPVALAPYIQYGTPSGDYETLGHAATGRGLDELWLGFFAGVDTGRWIPRTYVQMRYNFAFVEEVAGIGNNRSNLDFELGVRATNRLTLRAVVLFQDSHGGIDVPIPATHPLFPYHDQLASEDYTILGGGLSLLVGRRSTLYALYLESLKGRNGHKVDQSVGIGWSMGFQTRQ